MSVVTAKPYKASPKPVAAGRKPSARLNINSSVALAGFGLLAIVFICVGSRHPTSSYSNDSYQTSPSTSSGYYPAANAYSSSPIVTAPVPQYATPNTLPPPRDNSGPAPGTIIEPPVTNTSEPRAYYASPPQPSQGQPQDQGVFSASENAEQQGYQREKLQDEQDRQAIAQELRQRKEYDRARLEGEIADAERREQDHSDFAGSVALDQQRISDDQYKISEIDKDLAGQ